MRSVELGTLRWKSIRLQILLWFSSNGYHNIYNMWSPIKTDKTTDIGTQYNSFNISMRSSFVCNIQITLVPFTMFRIIKCYVKLVEQLTYDQWFVSLSINIIITRISTAAKFNQSQWHVPHVPNNICLSFDN